THHTTVMGRLDHRHDRRGLKRRDRVFGQRQGTSMACPHVAGAIALLLSRRKKQRAANAALKQLTAAQIRAALTQYTQNSGAWSPGMGFRTLDAESLVKAFD